MNQIKALIFTGYGLNCDYETQYGLNLAGAEPHRVHINRIIYDNAIQLEDYHILVFGGGFSWGDDHGAGVVMAAKIKRRLGDQLVRFVESGKLILGICNGFQCLVNLGLLPALNNRYDERCVALTYNDTGNFIDTWVTL
ncbi:MAG: phosphoribosylformylglycinamidine synthase, partial [Deltaproteobacteria bacterium]